MSRLARFYASTLGKKLIVAITGIFMLGFLLGHVTGNLKVFLPSIDGVPDIDHYAHSLRTIGEPFVPHGFLLWSARLVLLASLALHVLCIAQLAATNRSARPVGYATRRYTQATVSARWMLWTGCYLLGFIVLHILHFTVGVVEPEKFEHGAVYANLQAAFAGFPWAIFYIISLVVLALHLFHGIWSLFQTIGVDSPDRNRMLRAFAGVLSIGLFIGFAAVPTAFVTGVLDELPGVEANSESQPNLSTGEDPNAN